MLELDPIDRITVGAVGEPGHRTFYLQARQAGRLVTLGVEKQQVALLASSVVEILARVGKEVGEGPPEVEMALEEPLEPAWQAGRLTIGYDEARDLLLLEAEEYVEEAEETAEPDQVRMWASREQMMALARHGSAVVAAGRPTCDLCGNPIDPEGHLCPALNGHRRMGEA